jgi:hypothetical protein
MRARWLSWWRACLLRQLSGVESRHLSKIQNVRHKLRSGQHTLALPKNKQKKCFKICFKKFAITTSKDYLKITTTLPIYQRNNEKIIDVHEYSLLAKVTFSEAWKKTLQYWHRPKSSLK